MTALPVEAAVVAERGARGLVEIELVGLGPTSRPRLSVVVPAYHERASIAANLARLVEALDATTLSWEVIVVVDGDRETYLAALRDRDPRVQVYGYESNRGKGFALRFGMSKASGDLVTFIDSDMEISPDEIGRMAALLDLYHADVVVGSKRHPLSEVQYPWLRRLQSAGYQMLVRLLFRVRVRDTQTGLKMMRREVALRVLGAALVKRFAFDLELLALARHFGFRRIIEAPVRITYAFASTTNLRSVVWVLLDTLAIFYRLRLRRTYDRGNLGMVALLAALPAILGAD
ncbi:MAG TPA: glycosyltransferase [Candidatus Dormibacteraeota bacterium]|nr:glycosyltransferase [Candidatus Dormibacteraeota bacterium]